MGNAYSDGTSFEDDVPIHILTNYKDNNYHNYTMSVFIRNNYSNQNIKIYFNRCVRCNCCKRHSRYKPNLELLRFNDKPEINDPDELIYNCDCGCPCRHISRALYVAYTLN